MHQEDCRVCTDDSLQKEGFLTRGINPGGTGMRAALSLMEGICFSLEKAIGSDGIG